MEVSWNENHTETHAVDLIIRAYDRAGLLRDITAVLASEKINVAGLHTQKLPNSPEADIYLGVEIANKHQLHKAIDLLRKVVNVMDVKRKR